MVLGQKQPCQLMVFSEFQVKILLSSFLFSKHIFAYDHSRDWIAGALHCSADAVIRIYCAGSSLNDLMNGLSFDFYVKQIKRREKLRTMKISLPLPMIPNLIISHLSTSAFSMRILNSRQFGIPSALDTILTKWELK